MLQRRHESHLFLNERHQSLQHIHRNWQLRALDLPCHAGSRRLI